MRPLITSLYCVGEAEHINFAALPIEPLVHVMGFSIAKMLPLMTYLFCVGEAELVNFAALPNELLAHVMGFPNTKPPSNIFVLRR